MVKGLNIFSECFAGFGGQYIIIGATACSLAFEAMSLEFRATKDIDLVLLVEALSKDFVKAFWGFIRDGGYKHQSKSKGTPQYYRFEKPAQQEYPAMIELFSRKPDILKADYAGTLVPIPTDEELSSLSAIMLDDQYYDFIKQGRYEVDGLSCLKPEHLIVLKARAWTDLKQSKLEGGKIDGKNICKHRNDILRLYQIIDPELSLDLPDRVRDDLELCLKQLGQEPLPLKELGLGRILPEDIIEALKRLYRLS